MSGPCDRGLMINVEATKRGSKSTLEADFTPYCTIIIIKIMIIIKIIMIIIMIIIIIIIIIAILYEVASSLMVIFMRTSNYCSTTTTYVLFWNLTLFVSYAMLMRQKQLSLAGSIQANYFYGRFKE